jgi:hypothetical protein
MIDLVVHVAGQPFKVKRIATRALSLRLSLSLRAAAADALLLLLLLLRTGRDKRRSDGRRGQRLGLEIAMMAFCGFVALMMPPTLGAWSPTLQPSRAREDAAELRRLAGGRGQFCFWGDNVSIPLVFELRTIVPKATTPDELEHLASNEPRLLVLSISRPGRAAQAFPAGWERIAESRDEERTLEVYRAAR